MAAVTICSDFGAPQNKLWYCFPICFPWSDVWMSLQAGNKIAGRNTNDLRYADDTTLIGENEGALKSLLMKVKEESEKGSLKTQY